MAQDTTTLLTRLIQAHTQRWHWTGQQPRGPDGKFLPTVHDLPPTLAHARESAPPRIQGIERQPVTRPRDTATPFPMQGTSAEMERWLRWQQPHIAWNVAAVHPALLRQVAVQLAVMQRQFPGAFRALRGVTTEGNWASKPNSYAYMSWGDHVMHLNPAYFSNPQKLLAAVANDTTPDPRFGHAVFAVRQYGDARDIITHEFGHVLDFALREAPGSLVRLLPTSNFGRISVTWQRMRDRWLGAVTAANVSRYSQMNHEERWAELFTALQTPGHPIHTTEVGRAMAAWLQRVFAGPRYDETKYLTHHSVTDQERAEGIALLEHLARTFDLSLP